MNTDVVVSLSTQAMSLALKISLPLLLVGLVVGVVISIFQAVTSIQEQSLVFIPKVVAMAAVLVIGGPWMLNQLLAYTSDLWTQIPTMVGG
jgi:flagellar biosynthetic protein FliQ